MQVLEKEEGRREDDGSDPWTNGIDVLVLCKCKRKSITMGQDTDLRGFAGVEWNAYIPSMQFLK